MNRFFRSRLSIADTIVDHQRSDALYRHFYKENIDEYPGKHSDNLTGEIQSLLSSLDEFSQVHFLLQQFSNKTNQMIEQENTKN